MGWKNYEKIIAKKFQELYPDCKIEHNVKLKGYLSKIERQIDILVSRNIASYEINIAIDCKYYSKCIDVKDVDSFIGMMQDLKINKGVLITNKGYSEAAYHRAKNNNSPEIQLDIMSMFELNGYPGNGAIIYRGSYGVLLSTPPSWFIDGTKSNRNTLAYISSLDNDKSFMYVNIEPKKDPTGKLYKKDYLKYFIKLHERNTKKAYPKSTIEYKKYDLPKEATNIIYRIIERNVKTPQLTDNVEYSIIIEYDEFLFWCVYNTTKTILDLKPLDYIIKTLEPFNVVYKEDCT